MYLRTDYAVKELATLKEFVRENPLGIITTGIQSKQHSFLQSSHVPFLLEDADAGSESPGTLTGHMARANPQVKAMVEQASTLTPLPDSTSVELPDEVLVLFNSPYHSYISPKFYVDTKPTTGKTVPTWNYAAVQAYGKMRLYFRPDEETKEFLRWQVSELSEHNEIATGFQKPWKVTDAPENYTDLLMKSIVGMTIKLDRLEGKWKMSQERNEGDRQGVIEGLESLGKEQPAGVAQIVADSRPPAKAA